jgi:hypothetical protein
MLLYNKSKSSAVAIKGSDDRKNPSEAENYLSEDCKWHSEACVRRSEACNRRSEDRIRHSEARIRALFFLRMPYFAGRSVKRGKMNKI